LAQFQLLGIIGVTPANLATVQAAIAATANDLTGVDTVAELQAVVAIAAISAVAQADSATATTPDAAIYTAAGVTGVTPANLAAINDALDSTPVNGAATDTAPEIQAVVNAYTAILGEANGATPDATPGVNPTAAQYTAIGVTLGLAATDAENLGLLNDIIGAQSTTGVDSISELNNLAALANVIQAAAAGDTAPTLAQFTALGLTGVTADNLANVQQAIAATTNDGTQTDTLAKIQGIISSVLPALSSTQSLDNLLNFDVHSSLAISFTENVTAVSGKFIHLINDLSVGLHGENITNSFDIDVNSSMVTIVGNKVIINPAFDLDFNNNYHITIDDGAFVGTTSGHATAAVSDVNALNFTTVTPQDFSGTAGTLSQKFDVTGTLADGSYYLDLEDRSSPIGPLALINAAGKDFTFVITDYSKYLPAAFGPGDDAVATDDFNVRLYNFGLGDMLYIDTHGDNTDVSLARSSLSTFVNSGLDTLSGPGTRWKGISYAGILTQDAADVTGGGLGGEIQLSLAPSADTPSDSTVAVRYDTLAGLLGTDINNIYAIL
jgi:hypothetical protein